MSFVVNDRRSSNDAKPPQAFALFGVTKIVSGAQTGVDRAALDVARSLGLQHGGWVPAGRKAEDGIVGIEYQMRECLGGNAERTALNVRDADGTLLISYAPEHLLSGGSKLTKKVALKQKGKGFLHARLPAGRVESVTDANYAQLRAWLARCQIRTLNVAGPRESKEPGIYEDVVDFLTLLFTKEIA